MKKSAKSDRFSIEGILEDALQIVGAEIAKLKAQSEGDEAFDLSQSTRLAEYVKLALSVKREQRNERLEEQLEELSDEKLSTLAEEAIRHLQQQPRN